MPPTTTPLKTSNSFMAYNKLRPRIALASATQKNASLQQTLKDDVVIESRHGDAGSEPSFIFRHFLHKDAKISKLVTREDPYHWHKTLGMLALLNFFYRYVFC